MYKRILSITKTNPLELLFIELCFLTGYVDKILN